MNKNGDKFNQPKGKYPAKPSGGKSNIKPEPFGQTDCYREEEKEDQFNKSRLQDKKSQVQSDLPRNNSPKNTVATNDDPDSAAQKSLPEHLQPAWHACRQPYYRKNYALFLYHLYSSYTDVDESQRALLQNDDPEPCVQSLLSHEADHLSKLSSGNAEVLKNLVEDPFLPTGLLSTTLERRRDNQKIDLLKPEQWENSSNYGWTYLESAYRMRMIFHALFDAALATKTDGNYIDTFFKGIKASEEDASRDGINLLQNIFPVDVRKYLELNQSQINTFVKSQEWPEQWEEVLNPSETEGPFYAVNYLQLPQQGHEDNSLNPEGRHDIPDTKPGKGSVSKGNLTKIEKRAIEKATAESLKKPDGKDGIKVEEEVAQDITNTHERELAVPFSHDYVFTPGGGPIGPVSLEVAFILALQMSGINLRTFATFHVAAKGSDPPDPDQIAPAIHTAAFFAARPPDDSKKTAKLPRWQTMESLDIRTDNGTVHTAVRRIHTQFPWTSEAVGVYFGLDLLDGMGTSGVSNKYLPDSQRYFSFALHAVDTASTSVLIEEGKAGGKTSGKGTVAPRRWYVLNKDNKAPACKSEDQEGEPYPDPVLNCFRDQEPKFLGQTAYPQSKPSAGKIVRPHCHQGFWQDSEAFKNMFLKNWNNDTTKMPEYRQHRKHHMYLLSEADAKIFPKHFKRTDLKLPRDINNQAQKKGFSTMRRISSSPSQFRTSSLVSVCPPTRVLDIFWVPGQVLPLVKKLGRR